MDFSVKTNFPAVIKQAEALGAQMPFALATTLTALAKEVKPAEVDEMRKVFDRPTRYTLNSIYVSPATKSRLEARVWVKDSDRPTHYLLPQIFGGPRPQKRFEEILRKAGILGASERVVPGQGAQLDAAGNISRGQVVKIISQLRAFNLAGSDANATNSARSKGKRASVRYFVARKGEARQGAGSWKGGDKVQHLRTGIYAASEGKVVPVMIFVNGARYQQRLRFDDVANSVVRRRFDAIFARQYAVALRTARWG